MTTPRRPAAARSGRLRTTSRIQHNRPKVAAVSSAGLGTLALWLLTYVEFPVEVEAILAGLFAVVVGQLLGALAQRGTWPDDKVQALVAEVEGH